MRIHSLRRLSAAFAAMTVWAVLVAGAARAEVGPNDPGGGFVTRPAVVITESVGWTRYAVVALAGCLIGVAATLAVQLVLRRSRRTSIAHA